MRQLILNNIDIETAERLELRAKRLGTTPEEAASRLLRERLRMESEVAIVDDGGVVVRQVVTPVPSETVDVFEFIASVAPGSRSKEDIDKQVADERSVWADR